MLCAKNLPPGPGFRPHSRNESSHNVGESGGSAQDTISQCSTRIEEEDVELGILEDDFMNPPLQSETPPSTMETDTVDAIIDSPTTSKAIDMMDLHPNMMDEPFDSGFLQSSAPIPISARTVAGHEAARLGSQLAASQRQRRDTERGTIVEPRARSYDHQRQDKPEKEKHVTEQWHLERSGQVSLNVPVQKLLSLPHSFSSPEFPVPSVETSILNSTPLVTLHTSPLISPNSRISDVTNIMFPVPTIRSSYLDVNIKQPDDFNPRSQNKKYGRSHSEMILPGIERSGELIDSSKLSSSNSWLKSFFSLFLHERTPKTVTFTLGQITIEKYFHSLLPYISKCFCYNCNISKLILKSKDLPLVEHFNFDVYFARSFSHKFFNYSCYLNL